VTALGLFTSPSDNEEKDHARVPLRQSARLFPSAAPMLGAEQREIKNFLNCFKAPFKGAI
jgi:hypothetical protein